MTFNVLSITYLYDDFELFVLFKNNSNTIVYVNCLIINALHHTILAYVQFPIFVFRQYPNCVPV